MSPLPDQARFQKLDRLLAEALDQPESRRRAWLDKTLDDEPELKAELARLLSMLDENDSLDHFAEQVTGMSEEAADWSGTEAGPWRLQQRLGSGGMGDVYLAERELEDIRQTAAVKLMRPALLRPSLRGRFVQERRILARLSDPRIARLLDGGETEDGRIWLAMEYVEGVPIDEFCRQRRLDLAARLALLEDVIAAVQHAHQHLVIHRDIKPANILVTTEGQVRLLDFGIAKLLDDDETREQTVTQVLTPRYASPEQRAGKPVTTASDVYQLGLVMFELITGEQAGETLPRASHALHRGLADRGVPARRIRRRVRAVRGDLDRIIERATATNPDHRYPSCERLFADLRYHRDGWPIAARAGERWYRARRFLRRHRLAAGMIGVAVLATAVYAALAIQQARTVRAEAAKATAARDFIVELFRQADPGNTQGESPTLREVLDRSETPMAASLEDQPEIRAHLLHTLGELYQALGEYRQAESLLEQAIEISAGRRDHAGEARQRLSLAQTLREDSRHEEAEAQARLALDLAPGELERIRAETELGFSFLKQGRLADAEPLLRASLESYQGLPKQVSALEVARVKVFVAVLDFQHGRVPDAERRFQEAREVLAANLGPDHPEVSALNYNLARIAELRGDLATAEARFREVLASETRVLGADHPETAVTRNRLAFVLLGQRRLDDAETEFSSALDQLETTLHPRHQRVAENLMGSSETALLQGRLGEAERRLRRSMSILEHHFEWPDWHLAEALRIDAGIALARRDCARARDSLDRARGPLQERPEPFPSRWRELWERVKEQCD